MTILTREALYDMGPRLLREVWALTGVAISIIALRVVAKIRIRKFGLDDVLMVFALCLAIVGSVMITTGIQYGFGRHVGDINPNDTATVIFYDYLAQTFGIAGGTVGRVAFIVFVAGLLGTRKAYRVILWVLVGLQIITNGMFIVILFVQCPGHASAIWSKDGDGKCWDVRVQAYYGYYQGSFNAATDLYLAAFSTYVFWNLNLKLQAKLGLVTLLGLGLFAMVASIIKAVQTRVLAHADDDPTTATINLDRWLYIETYLVIITASIPCLKSLLRPFGRQTTSTGRSTYELGSPFTGSSGPRSRRLTPTAPGKGIMRISDGNASADDILEWDATDSDRVDEPAASKKSIHVYV